ncbi:MAG: TolC family protein [Planctomycetota bacterium]|nr:MAG: TolC family protein [Planctomycetota bacterium]
MNSRSRPALALCLVMAGCAGPMDRTWDDSTYQAIRDRYGEKDRRIADDSDDGSAWPSTSIHSLDALSVEDAIRIAIVNNPRLRSAGYRVDAATGRVTQAGLYPNPAFVFEGEGLGSDAGRGGDTIYKLEQEIVLGGKLDRARDVAEADRLAAQAAFVAEEFAVASRVTRAYFDALASAEGLARRQDLADLANQLLEAASAQVDAGAATEPDRLRAEVVAEQAQIELEAARLDADASRRTLASVMGLEETIDLPLSTSAIELPQLPDREGLVAAVLEANSRVSLARIALERARAAHALARSEGVPNLFAAIGPRYSDPENETTLDLSVGIGIPLFDRNQGEIRAAMAERLSAAAELRSVQLDLLAEVSDAWAAYQAALMAATRFREQLLPKADRTLELTRQAYERGKTDYLRLLDAQQVVVESRIAYVDALRRLHEAAALLRELAQTDAPWREPRPADSPGDEVTP